LRPRAIGPSRCYIDASRQTALRVIRELACSLRYGLLLADLLGEVVRHACDFTRHVDTQRASASQSGERSGGVNREFDRAECRRILKHNLSSLLPFGIDPNGSTCGQRGGSVNGVYSGVLLAPFVPRGAVIVHVGKHLQVALVSSHTVQYNINTRCSQDDCTQKVRSN